MSRQSILEHLVNKQFEIAGYDTTVLNYQNLVKTKNKDWFTVNTISKENEQKFKEYFLKHVKQMLKLNDKKVNAEYNFFYLSYGLKCVDNE